MEKNAGLSAPEAYLLISLPLCDPSKALKLGFMGLVAQGVLVLETEDRRGLLRTRHIPHLHVASGSTDALPPVAASLVRVVRGAEPRGLIKDVLAQCHREYGRTLMGIMQDCLGPALVARGLAEPYRRRILGVFSVASFRRTPAGEAEKLRIQELMQDARSIPSYLDRDPAQAAALVAALGAAILLVEELRPHYQALGLALRERDAGSSGDGGWTSGDFSGDFGGIGDFGAIDFSCFDGGAFDSFDAGFDAGGGDGGGGSSGC
jgi:uncharacterized membrane protein YgcG